MDGSAPDIGRTTAKNPGREGSTRDDILDAAARLIVEQGFGACTMRSISERVKIKAGSLYYHFNSKDEIVVEIMNMGVKMLLDQVQLRIRRLPESATFSQRFRAAVKAHVACKTDTSMPYMQVYEHLPPIIKRESRVMRQKYADSWRNLLMEGQQSGEVRKDLDIEVFLPYFLGGLNRVPEWYHREKMSVDKVGEGIANTLLSGLMPPK